MPIEIAIGAYFLWRQAGALVGGILEKTRENFEQEGADQLTRFVSKLAKGQAGRTSSDSTAEAEPEAEITTQESDTHEVLKENEAEAEELQRQIGVELTSALPPDRTGTDASVLRAYEAALWRLSVLASWERRAIAVSGALQGRNWITICAPAPKVLGAVVEPSSIWEPVNAESALRRPLKGGPVDFFVKPLADNAKREEELTEIDNKLRRNGSKRFEPPQPVEPSDVDVWHRVDGLHAVWASLQPDAATSNELENANVLGLEGLELGRRNVELHPPIYEEYPPEWQRTLLNVSPVGLAALVDGLDEFASKSKAARDAVDNIVPPSNL